MAPPLDEGDLGPFEVLPLLLSETCPSQVYQLVATGVDRPDVETVDKNHLPRGVEHATELLLE